MHCLIEAQALPLGPVEDLVDARLARHLGRARQGLEGDVLGAALRVGALDHLREQEADPAGHHGSAFHAAHAVDPLFQRHGLEEYICPSEEVYGG